MGVRRKLTVAGVAACLAAIGQATPGSADSGHTIKVHQGQSIQAAIDEADPGDTIVVFPGTYHENLVITKDRLTLKSAEGRGTVFLDPGATPNECSSPTTPGICIHGDFGSDPVNPSGHAVTGTRIEGFVVEHMNDFGIFLFHADNSRVSDSEARDNAAYGISGFVLSGISFTENVSHDNGDPGFYIGDSPHANAVVTENTSFRNGVGGEEGFGFLFRDSSHGAVWDNRAWDNCAGFVFADTGEDPAPESDWRATDNTSLHNNGFCPGVQHGPPPTSGIGFVLFGGNHISLRDNTADDNRPSGPSVASGGIDVISSRAIGGSDPTNNAIVGNEAFRNAPFDIFWDGSGHGNRFADNDCGTSHPAGICGEGDD